MKVVEQHTPVIRRYNIYIYYIPYLLHDQVKFSLKQKIVRWTVLVHTIFPV